MKIILTPAERGEILLLLHTKPATYEAQQQPIALLMRLLPGTQWREVDEAIEHLKAILDLADVVEPETHTIRTMTQDGLLETDVMHDGTVHQRIK